MPASKTAMGIGAGAGAVGGAALGTAIFPGIGTIGGAALGGVAGGLGGAALGGLLSGGGQVDEMGGPTYDFGQIDYNIRPEIDQARAQQLEASEMFRRAALGNGPSAAQAQFQANTDANLAAQRSAANSARGGATNQAMAQRAAIYSTAASQQQAANQAAMLRAQEQQAAQQGFAQMANATRGADQENFRNEADVQLGLGQQQVGMASVNAGIRKNNADNEAKGLGGMFSAASGMLGLSDERAKSNVRPASQEIRSFLDALEPSSFEYRADPGEAHFGVIAQDLQKTPVGRQMVVRDPNSGYLMIDAAQGFGPVLAAEAELNRRLAALESHIKRSK